MAPRDARSRRDIEEVCRLSPVARDLTAVEQRPATIGEQFLQRVRSSGDREAYRYPVGDRWESLSWAETGEKVSRLAAGLVALGIEPEQRVGIASGTRVEWILADLAILCAGAATTTVYPSTIADDVGYILADSECRIVFAEDDTQVAKLRENRAELPMLGKVVTFDPATRSEGDTADGDWVIGLDDLERLGADLLAQEPTVVETRITKTSGDSLATLIYTSGTTGRPKGVRLRHSSWTYEGAAVEALDILSQDDLQYLWLPMAHSFGKVLLSTQLACGFATAVDGRVDKLIENLAVVKPTFMGAAPRIFEKAHGRIVTMQKQEGGAKEKIFNAAFSVGFKVKRLQEQGKSVPLPLRAQHALFDRLVFSKIRDRFGGRVRFFISGAAALNREVAEWFHVAGILILEGYGLTETSAGSLVNHPDDYRFGTVGLVFPGSEVKIADDGEVLIKGPGVMEGYHNMPEATQETLVDGWLHTGDIGDFDGQHLRITDRKKDLFKTSGGKYIAPSAIESQFKAICPLASQFLVHGAERNYCVALITLDPDAVASWAQHEGRTGMAYEEIVTLAEVEKVVEGYVGELNKRLNRWESIKKWVILDHDLTVESGELTPSMKVKRRVVEDNYRDKIEAMYDS
ncbi:MAG: Long-chain-fatty-acid--CoA ligase [uncultured Nocardioidaceae bacterium]|uniref:Long-chain-fatty-acid--CoA ligase n=1 Tax=uncultured Nocardioidaceae bacterium TaxID=253824 RepID=A0A6J4MTN0_9ACTN|nr:MAG: Long-chain-fatty-acid--CoA ligase [uncultured Nocardioidaceae bacterium]